MSHTSYAPPLLKLERMMREYLQRQARARTWTTNTACQPIDSAILARQPSQTPRITTITSKYLLDTRQGDLAVYRQSTECTLRATYYARGLAPNNAIFIGTSTCHTKGFTTCGVVRQQPARNSLHNRSLCRRASTSKPSCGCPNHKKVLSCAWPHNTKATHANKPTMSQPNKKHMVCWQLTATRLLHHQLPRRRSDNNPSPRTTTYKHQC